MNDDNLKLLQTSKDPKELVNAALSLARSKQASDHEALMKQLRSADFLTRLDSEADYRETRKRLRIYRVIDALKDNPAPSSRTVLLGLTESAVFLEEARRTDHLIKASSVIKPPPSQLIKFWDKHSQPDDGFTPLTIGAMVENGAAPSMGLFEKKMADMEHDEDAKLSWIRSSVLVHRDDLELLLSCERMLQGGMPSNLREPLIEVLFDYRPDDWFMPDRYYPQPPDRVKASPESLAQLRKIGQLALKTVPLAERLKEVVEKTLEDIEKKR